MKTTIFVLTLLLQTSAFASNLEWNGFASVYGRKTLTDEVYDPTNNPRHVDFSSNSKVGLNIRSDFADNWSAIGQLVVSQKALFSQTPGPAPQWTPEFDWFFLSYDYSDNWNIKAGRQLLPSFLVAEYIDVGLTYPWRKPPTELYSIAPFKSYEGLSATYSHPIAQLQASAKIFGGTSHPHLEAGLDTAMSINDMFGFAFTLAGDGWLTQIVAHREHPMMISKNYSGGVGSTTEVAPFGSTVKGYSAGIKYDKNNNVAYFELGHNDGNGISTFNDHGYQITLGHRIGSWLPYYAHAYSDIEIIGNFSGFEVPFVEGKQTSHTVGLNYQVDPAVVLKSEFMWQQSKDGAALLSGEGIARSVALGADVVF